MSWPLVDHLGIFKITSKQIVTKVSLTALDHKMTNVTN